VSAKTYKCLLAGFLSLAVFHAPASFALVDWWTTSTYCTATTGSSSSHGNGCNGEFADSRTFKDETNTHYVEATAWANTSNSSAGGYNNSLAPGKIAQYGGGLGVRNADYNHGDSNEGRYPEHAMDNNGRFDMILFDFQDVQISLEQISVGWYKYDADISVLAYTGSTPFDPASLNNRELSGNAEDLTTNGWEIVGNYDADSYHNNTAFIQKDSNHDEHDDRDSNDNTNAMVSSSYWLIGAYNPVFGSAGCDEHDSHSGDDSHSSGCSRLASGNDYLKIMDLAGSIVSTAPPPSTSVPEPTSLLLLASALFISPKLRRARKQA